MSAADGNSMSDDADKGTKAEGNFFAVDSRLWERVCALGLNEAVSYLVQARGTARDNRTTTWSVESIERYTGISRHRAAAALKALQANGFVKLLRAGTKPKYDLIPFSELPEADQRPALDSHESWIFQRVQKAGKLTKSERSYAQRITKKGWLIEKDGGFTVAPPPKVEPDLIWLPNELVTGAAHETPPLELVRQMQDVMTLRLLIDMYHAHNLREDGGVSRHCMSYAYHRFKVNERAQFVIWGFRPLNEQVWIDLVLPLRHKPHPTDPRGNQEPEKTALLISSVAQRNCTMSACLSGSRTSSRAMTQAARSSIRLGTAGPTRLKATRAGRAPGRTRPHHGRAVRVGRQQRHSVPRAGAASCRQRADDRHRSASVSAAYRADRRLVGRSPRECRKTPGAICRNDPEIYSDCSVDCSIKEGSRKYQGEPKVTFKVRTNQIASRLRARPLSQRWKPPWALCALAMRPDR